MKNSKQFLLAAAFALCVFAGSASAQKDEKKTPPKGNVPIVIVGDKDKDKEKKDKPKEDKKKPQSFVFFFRNE